LRTTPWETSQLGAGSCARILVDIDAEKPSLDSGVEKRREERFYWIILAIIIFDIEEFRFYETCSGPIVVGIIEILAIIALGKRLGVDHIWTVTEKLIKKWNGAFPGRRDQ
jgi:hypothetical protein